MLGEDAIDILCDAGRKSSWRLVLIVGGSAMDIVFDSGLPSGLTWGEKAIDILLRVRKGGRDPSLLEAIEALERESVSGDLRLAFCEFFSSFFLRFSFQIWGVGV